MHCLLPSNQDDITCLSIFMLCSKEVSKLFMRYNDSVNECGVIYTG